MCCIFSEVCNNDTRMQVWKMTFISVPAPNTYAPFKMRIKMKNCFLQLAVYFPFSYLIFVRTSCYSSCLMDFFFLLCSLKNVSCKFLFFVKFKCCWYDCQNKKFWHILKVVLIRLCKTCTKFMHANKKILLD